MFNSKVKAIQQTVQKIFENPNNTELLARLETQLLLTKVSLSAVSNFCLKLWSEQVTIPDMMEHLQNNPRSGSTGRGAQEFFKQALIPLEKIPAHLKKLKDGTYKDLNSEFITTQNSGHSYGNGDSTNNIWYLNEQNHIVLISQSDNDRKDITVRTYQTPASIMNTNKESGIRSFIGEGFAWFFHGSENLALSSETFDFFQWAISFESAISNFMDRLNTAIDQSDRDVATNELTSTNEAYKIPPYFTEQVNTFLSNIDQLHSAAISSFATPVHKPLSEDIQEKVMTHLLTIMMQQSTAVSVQSPESTLEALRRFSRTPFRVYSEDHYLIHLCLIDFILDPSQKQTFETLVNSIRDFQEKSEYAADFLWPILDQLAKNKENYSLQQCQEITEKAIDLWKKNSINSDDNNNQNSDNTIAAPASRADSTSSDNEIDEAYESKTPSSASSQEDLSPQPPSEITAANPHPPIEHTQIVPTIQTSDLDHQGLSARLKNLDRDLRATYAHESGKAIATQLRPASTNTLSLPAHDTVLNRAPLTREQYIKTEMDKFKNEYRAKMAFVATTLILCMAAVILTGIPAFVLLFATLVVLGAKFKIAHDELKASITQKAQGIELTKLTPPAALVFGPEQSNPNSSSSANPNPEQPTQ